MHPNPLTSYLLQPLQFDDRPLNEIHAEQQQQLQEEEEEKEALEDDEEGEQDEEEEEQAVQGGPQSIDGLRAQYPVRALQAGHALSTGNIRVLARSGFVVLPQGSAGGTVHRQPACPVPRGRMIPQLGLSGFHSWDCQGFTAGIVRVS